MPGPEDDRSRPVLHNGNQPGTVVIEDDEILARFLCRICVDTGSDIVAAMWEGVMAEFAEEPEVGQPIMVGDTIFLVVDVDTESLRIGADDIPVISMRLRVRLAV